MLQFNKTYVLSRLMKKQMMFVVVVLIVLSSLYGVTTQSAPATSQEERTPRSLEKIFIGRCLEYQQVIRPDLFPQGKSKNCSKLWLLFKLAFAFKDPCNVPVESYEEYSKEADHEIETTDRVMFWSGKVVPFVTQYTAENQRFLTIRDTLGAYSIKNVRNWCGQLNNNTGINYQECPQWGECENLAVPSFWKQMSKQFATKARGRAHVMLNVSNENAFNPKSIFAQMELKSLTAEHTPEVYVHLIYNLDEQPKESCSKGSILKLKKILEDKKIVFKCFENEDDLRFLQCVDKPNSKACKSSFDSI